MIDPQTLESAVITLREGGIIAYPTEAVWGLGCDPDNEAALETLIRLKQRDPAKGLILIAGDIAQLEPWLTGLGASDRERLAASWPGPVTWLVPDNGRSRFLLRGQHASVALRVSDHPVVAELCAAFGGPLVSTSANRAQQPPALDSASVREHFAGAVLVVEGPLGGYARPSTIRDLHSGGVLRE
ncbi:L-threonylcarbamoyladenylate synthase [Modicisalibacter ilicicola DSM 19980]|uniref:Threonylcarbamoyl-AMP synthase n=1 Tax=Modicisalibacter ilicicola DSM 19980 TaxID=1121942 RepID=A0A1M4TB52_9GAMM|nr:Sua5/YciO/YrdC/YwlC family protein [Halomonas ilicicola]SHE41660.1 L-threonylcarbamoyladenylate synthase [Halomonas ilicicola DSM 19980]